MGECHTPYSWTLQFTQKTKEEEEKSAKAGLWAESMIIPFRGSERSVVECSCH